MMKRGRNAPSEWIDPAILYSRQEIADRVGLTDDILSFWIKRGLLIPEGVASGKGVHHKFHYSQVNVAVVLKAMRDHFGANIGTLKSLAETLQEAIRLFRSTKAEIRAWGSATTLADRLAKFRAGERPEVMFYDHRDGDIVRKQAESEAEIIAEQLDLTDAPASEVIQLAHALGPGRLKDREIAMALLGAPIDPRHCGSDTYWLLAHREDGWHVYYDADDGTRDRSYIGPAIFLPAHSMVRKVWGIPDSGLIRTMDTAEQYRAALKDAGLSNVEVIVERGKDEPDVKFELNGSTMEEVEAALLPFFGGHRHHQEDVDWRRYHGIQWNPSDEEKAQL